MEADISKPLLAVAARFLVFSGRCCCCGAAHMLYWQLLLHCHAMTQPLLVYMVGGLHRQTLQNAKC